MILFLFGLFAIILQSVSGEHSDRDEWLKEATKEERLEEGFKIDEVLKLKNGDEDYISQGTFGKVVRIKYRENKEKEYSYAALKIINTVKAMDDSIRDFAASQRILNDTKFECEMMRKLNNSNETYTPKLYGCFTDYEIVFILTEMLFVSLDDKAFKEEFKRFSLIKKFELFVEIAKAVEVIHNYKEKTADSSEDIHFVHNDIKEANFMLTHSLPQHVKIIDMGLIKQEGTEKTGGSKYYMPIERLNPEYKVKQSSDIWSIGVVYCEMLLGPYTFSPEKINYEINTKTKKYEQLISNLESQFSTYTSKWGETNDKRVINLFKDFLLDRIFVPEENRCKIDDTILRLENLIRALLPSGVKSWYVTDDSKLDYEEIDVFYIKPLFYSPKKEHLKTIRMRKLHKNISDFGDTKSNDIMVQEFSNSANLSQYPVIDSIADNIDQLSNLII